SRWQAETRGVRQIAKWVELGESTERIAIGDSFRLAKAENLVGQFTQELHSSGVIVADAVPLDHRKFRIVQRAGFAASESPRDLGDGRRAGGQQPFHAEFGRCL